MSKLASRSPANSNSQNLQGGRACPKCGSHKMARSQLESYDALKVNLLGKRPYRCMQCYHRAWLKKPSAQGRKMSVLVVVLALLVMVLSVYKSFVEQPVAPSVSIVVPSNSPETQETAPRVEQSTPSLASLINMPDQRDSSESGGESSLSSIDYVDRQVDQLSAEQQAALLSQAKNQSEAAEQLSQARVEQLESVLLPVGDELESLVKVEVGYIVERWREAWATGDVEDYLTSYGANFVPANDLSIEDWRRQRRSRVSPQKQIELGLSGFDISMSDDLNQGTVYFNQRYRSGSYVENSRKRLILEKEDGTWKIVSELELKE